MKQRVETFFHTLTILLNIRLVYNFEYETTISIVRGHNYPVESHTVYTEDGYILRMFRIPYSPRFSPAAKGKAKPVFFLQHGLLCSSDIFLLNGPDDGLPYMLADAGYDVWLGNARGNPYSRRHIELDPNIKEFWKFSWHEIGIYDISAMIKYVLAKTRQNSVHYVGHSQGGTVFLVLMSMLPEFNHVIKTCHLLAPAAFMQDLKLPLLLKYYLKLTGYGEYVHSRTIMGLFASKTCKYFKTLCERLYFLYYGTSKTHMNHSTVPLLLETYPVSISIRQPLHFLQLHESGEFRQFDYGSSTNYDIYGYRAPPYYRLSKISTQVNIIYSKDDKTISTRDIQHLSKHLPNCKLNLISVRDWVHMDFLLGISVKSYINLPIIRAANAFEKETYESFDTDDNSENDDD